jgi:mannose-6-phosphate isomerase-like protein (cupin superfamily)
MKVFKIEEFMKMENPKPGTTYKQALLKDLQARSLSGVFGLVVPGSKGGDYHYHEKGEHVIFILSGEGIELVEGKEFPVKAGDVIFVPAGVKHTTLNKSEKDLRYIGFLTCTPGQEDRFILKESV